MTTKPRRPRRSLLAAVAAAALGVVGLAAAPASAQEWRGWNIHAADYPNGIGMDAFTRIVGERTSNRIRMRTFHSAQLGQQDEAIQQMRLGTIDFANFNLSPFNNLAPTTNVVTLPFLFRDVGHMQRAIDGPAGEAISADLERIGIIALAWYDAGARSIYTTRPVRTPADLRGMKIRVQTSDLWIDLMRALNANPTPLPFGEVFTSLQSGVIDGAENNWPSYESTRHFEVARYYSTTEHSNVPEVLAVSQQRWRRLNEQERAILRDAARESARIQRAAWADRERVSRERVVAAGVTVIEIQDRAPWATLMEPVYAKYAADARLAALVQQIRALP
ncbi:TRAP transporter substrate-binding protein [Neoroseomonas oryzicola]|uniref:TRAP transporter substrate-binding protein n=1 Tax=Neoroseomonas oryzicola TaxID=535904 RepID=A0A9X9WJQ9_9PROT|nr:TRAP transporter substrate-binding protein [Neoroseomonas oryzicola]MBR0660569.1 TRAP transporter substrate-binding protein [Neoroseomonas oryzicola]NKE16832.1 TRAP transporter substrate-binding protein [Neoroseomonas oryzicola]